MTTPNESCLVDEGDLASKEAADWFARLADDRATEADCEAYRAWRAASSDNAQAYDLIASVWETTARFADERSILGMRLGALADTSAPSFWRRYGSIAAALVLMAIGMASLAIHDAGWLGVGNTSPEITRVADAGSPDDQALPASSAAAADAGQQDASAPAQLSFSSAYSTRIGEMSEFSLPDGSSIALNTASQVLVDFSSDKRELILVRGEAMFTVAKDADRPFTVSAGNNRVVALGTVFAVRRTGEEAQVTLIEGRVRVDRNDASGHSAMARLVAGEQLLILPDRSFEISKAEIARATSWREGRLVFAETPLREVLEEFNRYSNEKHVLRDEGLGDFLVSGTFRITSSEHFAATLEAGFPVVVRARAGGKILEVYSSQD